MATTVLGASALHCVITPNCVRVQGDQGMGAFDEAVRRTREMYETCLKGWVGQGKVPTFHLLLTVDRNEMEEQDGPLP